MEDPAIREGFEFGGQVLAGGAVVEHFSQPRIPEPIPSPPPPDDYIIQNAEGSSHTAMTLGVPSEGVGASIDGTMFACVGEICSTLAAAGLA